MRNMHWNIAMPSKVQILESHEHAERVRRLGERIRARRKGLGVSATAAAEAAGMSRVTWHRIEKGEFSVTIGAWFNALAVLGLEFSIGPEDLDHQSINPEEAIPVQIRLTDYPQLQSLAWQVSDSEFVTPREAMDTYERNWRHLDEGALEQGERALIDNLRNVFGTAADHV